MARVGEYERNVTAAVTVYNTVIRIRLETWPIRYALSEASVSEATPKFLILHYCVVQRKICIKHQRWGITTDAVLLLFFRYLGKFYFRNVVTYLFFDFV